MASEHFLYDGYFNISLRYGTRALSLRNKLVLNNDHVYVVSNECTIDNQEPQKNCSHKDLNAALENFKLEVPENFVSILDSFLAVPDAVPNLPELTGADDLLKLLVPKERLQCRSAGTAQIWLNPLHENEFMCLLNRCLTSYTLSTYGTWNGNPFSINIETPRWPEGSMNEAKVKWLMIQLLTALRPIVQPLIA